MASLNPIINNSNNTHNTRTYPSQPNQNNFINQKPHLLDKPLVGVSGTKFVAAESRLDTLRDQFDDKTLVRMGIIECETCSSRSYQDGSDDPGVSFKAPTKLSPEQAASMVVSHEQEHVSRDKAQVESEGGEVISQSVRIFTDVCPECGKHYVSGGLTTTMSKTPVSQEAKNAQEALLGLLVDLKL